MITNRHMVEELEDRLLREESLTHEEKLRLLEAMLEHARAMGALPGDDPLEGIEVDIELARVLNAL